MISIQNLVRFVSVIVFSFALFSSTAFADSVSTSTPVSASVLQGLHLGSQGDAVIALQAFLASDPQIYPQGLITGYFGPLTAQALRRYQARYNIATTAYVGTQTMQQLQAGITTTPLALQSSIENGSVTKKACAIVPPGHLIAPGWLRKQGNQTPIVSPCQILPPGIISQLFPTTTTTTPSYGTLSFLNFSAVSTTSTAIALQWNTNRSAISSVSYGTTTAYGSTTPWESTFTTNHVAYLSGLLSSTLYHFRVIAKDNFNTIATSSDMVFYTAADMTGPAISNVTISGLATTSATINWSTNELATSKVYFSTSTPLLITNASIGYSGFYTLSHSLLLTNLASSTLYLYEIESQDQAGNSATSTVYSFHTL